MIIPTRNVYLIQQCLAMSNLLKVNMTKVWNCPKLYVNGWFQIELNTTMW